MEEWEDFELTFSQKHMRSTTIYRVNIDENVSRLIAQVGNPQMGCRASPQRARGPSRTLGFTDQRSYTGNVSHQNV